MTWRVKKISENEYLVTADNGFLPPPETVIQTLFGPSILCTHSHPGEGYTLELYFTVKKGFATILTDEISFIYIKLGNYSREFYEDFSLPKVLLM